MLEQITADFMQRAINAEVERATKEEVDKAIERIEQRKNEIIAGVILSIERHVRFETHGQELVIRVIQK